MAGKSRRPDYYRILGVPRDADQSQIHDAYRRRAKECHPDAMGSGAAGERFIEIGDAYNVLGDAERRRSYDRESERSADNRARSRRPHEWTGSGPGRSTWADPHMSSDPHVTGSFFGRGRAGGLLNELWRELVAGVGHDVLRGQGRMPDRSEREWGSRQSRYTVDIDVSPQEARRGCVADLAVPGPYGTPEGMRFVVPPGVRDGTRLRASVTSPPRVFDLHIHVVL